MNAFSHLLADRPLIFFHLVTAVGAIVLGAVLMLGRKGSLDHRVLGWSWVVLMGSTTMASAFIRDTTLPNLAGVTPIHALTALVAVVLPLGVAHARRRRVAAHRKTMKYLYLGACGIAGLFTLLPGRLLGGLLWKQWLGMLA